MKLLLTLLVSGQLGLFSCQWLEKQRGSHLGAMAAEFENEFADDMMQQLVAAEARSPSARRASRSSTSGDAPGTCFLCQKPLAQSQAKTFLNLSLHEPCKHAVRAHWRLLNPEEKKLDADFRKADAVAWREPIICLIVGDGGKRPIKEHKDKLVHLTGFHEAARNKEQLLLTKKRFCKFQVFWGECEHEESASESWERRYNDSESSHRNSDDEPQVRTRGNSSITERSGRLMIKDLPGKRQGRGGGDDASDENCGDHDRKKRRGRDGGRSRSSRRRRERRSTPPRDRRAGTNKSAAVSSAAVVPSVRSPGRRAAVVDNKFEKPTAKSTRRRCTGNTSQGGKKGSASALAVLVESENEDVKEDQTMSYLAALTGFETQLEMLLKATTQKNWCAARLSQRTAELNPEQLKRISKKEDPKLVVKKIGEKVTTLRNMKKELWDMEDHQVDDFRARLKQVIKELRQQETIAESLLESCSFLKRKEGGQKRVQNLADSYQKRKWTNKLKAAEWDKEFAGAAVTVMLELEPVAVCGLEAEATWDAVLSFQETEGYGGEVFGAIKELQIKHSQEYAGKSESVVAWLKEHESKNGVLNKVQGGDQVPQLKAMIKSLPEAMWHQDPGSSAWIGGARNRVLCWGPSRMPLAGIGGFVQLCPNSPPVTFFMINAEALSKNGLLNFNEAVAFFSKEGGVNMVKDSSAWITLENPGQLLWLPYAAIAIPIAGAFEPDDKKSEKEIATWWHWPLFNSDLAAKVTDQCWKSILEWNKGHMSPLVGQAIWKERLQVLEKLEAARASMRLGSPTTMGLQ